MFALLYNLYTFLREKSERKITLVILGVDNAGKTTLLHTLKGEHDKETSPTFGFNSSTNSAQELGLGSKNLILQVFDLGGGQSIRRVWKSYLAEVHGVVFVVDAADRGRFDECQQVLLQTIDQKHLHGKPILVLANKQDLNGAASSADVAAHLGLPDLKANDFHIKACTAKPQPGQPTDPRLQEGMKWLLSTVGSMFSQLDSRVQQDAAEVKQEDLRRKKEREERVRKIKEERLQQQQAEERQRAEEEATAAAIAAAKVELGVAQVDKEERGDTAKDGDREMGKEQGGAVPADGHVEALSSGVGVESGGAAAAAHQGSTGAEDLDDKARKSALLQQPPREGEGEQIPLLGAMGEEGAGMGGTWGSGERAQQQMRQQQLRISGPILPGGVESPTLTPVSQAQGGHQPRHYSCSPAHAGFEESITLCPLAAQPSPKTMPNGGGFFAGSVSQEGSLTFTHDQQQNQDQATLRMSTGAVPHSSSQQYMQHAEQLGDVGEDASGAHMPQLHSPPHHHQQQQQQQQQWQQQQPHLVLHPPQSPIATPATLPDSPAANPLPQYATPDALTPSTIRALPHSQAATPLSHLSPRLQQRYPPAHGSPPMPPTQVLHQHPPDHMLQPARAAYATPSTFLTGAHLQGSAVCIAVDAGSASRPSSEPACLTNVDYGDAPGVQAHLESMSHPPPDPQSQPRNGWQLEDALADELRSQGQGAERASSPEGSTSRPGSASNEPGGASQRGQGISNAGGLYTNKGSLSRQNRVAPVP